MSKNILGNLGRAEVVRLMMERVREVIDGRDNNSLLKASAGIAMVAAIAYVDWHITAHIPLSFLYLIPMVLFGRIFSSRMIVVLAALCMSLAEAYDELPLTVSEGIPRLLLYFSAYAATGLLVRESHRRRSQSQSYIELIERQRNDIQEAGNQLQSLIESSPAAITTTNVNGRIVMANEAAHKMFGVETQSLTNRFIHEFIPSLANAQGPNSSHPRFRAVMQSRGFRSDGGVFLAEICFSTYSTALGPRLTAVIIDTSEDLRQSEEISFEQLMIGSRTVAGGMSHEIRNVCAAIAIVNENLRRNQELAGNQDLSALSGLVHALKELAAVDLSHMKSTLTKVDLLATLNDLKIILTPTFEEANISHSWIFEADLSTVWGSRSQIIQIFLNLSSNSIRALSHVLHPHINIRVVKSPEHKIYIWVDDNGDGITDAGRLFHPFQQGANSSGLGLFLSRAFARSMGGDLKYIPSTGKTCFLLELLSADRTSQRVD